MGRNGRWIPIGSAPSDVTIDHNTVLHDGPTIYVYGGSCGAELTVANLRFTNNLVKHNSYGIVGDGRATAATRSAPTSRGRRCSGTPSRAVGVAVSRRKRIPDGRVLAGAVPESRRLELRPDRSGGRERETARS